METSYDHRKCPGNELRSSEQCFFTHLGNKFYPFAGAGIFFTHFPELGKNVTHLAALGKKYPFVGVEQNILPQLVSQNPQNFAPAAG